MKRSNRRRAAQRLRYAVERLPRHTREAMLEGMDSNEIIVGAYVHDGGVCPMLAAHRNGGRTNFSSFARAWDRFTDARSARRATEREVRVLRSYLEMSMLAEEHGDRPLRELAAELRTDRERLRAADAAAERLERAAERGRDALPPDTGERHRGRELRGRSGWSWLRPARTYDQWQELLAAAEEQAAEAEAARVLSEDRRPEHARA